MIASTLTSRPFRSSAPTRIHPRWVGPAVGLAFAALLIRVCAMLPFVDVDVFHEMALAREAISRGALPRVDLWAFTPTLPEVVHHEWGIGVVLYGLVVGTGWGWPAIALLRLVLVLGIAGACYAAGRRNGAHGTVLALCAPMAIALLVPGLSPIRAQLFTFAGLAALLLVFHADRAGRRGWIAPWLLTWVVWVNLHGGFVLGLAFAGLYVLERVAWDLRDGHTLATAGRRHARMTAVGVAMAGAVLLNPYGTAYVDYLWHAIGMDRPLISEWAPMWSAEAQPELRIVFGVAAAFLLYAVAARRTLRLPGLSLVVFTGYIALQHQRMAPVFAVVWFAHVPAYLSATPLGALIVGCAARWAAPAGVAAVAAACACIWTATTARFWDLRLPGPGDGYEWTAPAGAVEHLRSAGFRGNLLTHFDEGAFVSWELYPAVRISMDSRYEAAYPARSMDSNVGLYAAAPGWREMLTRTGADAALVPVSAPLASALALDRQWTATYRDAGHAVYLRRPR